MVVEYLIRASPQVAQLPLTVPNSGPLSPLHLAAASNGSLEVVQAIATAAAATVASPEKHLGQALLAAATDGPDSEIYAIVQIAALTNPNEAVVNFLAHQSGCELYSGEELCRVDLGTPLYRQGVPGVWRWMNRPGASVA